MKNILLIIVVAFMLIMTIGNIGFYAGRSVGVEPTLDITACEDFARICEQCSQLPKEE